MDRLKTERPKSEFSMRSKDRLARTGDSSSSSLKKVMVMKGTVEYGSIDFLVFVR